MSLLPRGHASLLQAVACSLLTQSCILLYDADGAQGGNATATGQGGNGGQAGSTSATGGGGNSSGGGGNGGDGGSGGFSCGAVEGAFPLVDVGEFAPGSKPVFATIQALAPRPDGNIVAAGFSGSGFTTSGGCMVGGDTFFLIQVAASGAIGQPISLPTLSGEQPVISLARGPDALLLGTSRAEKLRVQNLDVTAEELSPGKELLACNGVDPTGQTLPQILQGRVVSNGMEVAVVAQLQSNVQYECQIDGVTCPIVPGGPRLLLWSPGADVGCNQLQFLEAPAGSDYAAPRLALGPGSPADVLLTMHGKAPGGTNQLMVKGTLTGGAFTFTTPSTLGPQAGLVVPTVPATKNAVIGGVVGTVGTDPPIPAAFLQLAQEFAPITEATLPEPLLDAPDGGTNSRITALHSTDSHVLALAQVDQGGATTFGPPNSSCPMGQCGLWSLFDTSLTLVGNQLTGPGVVPSVGLLVPAGNGAPDVVWAASYSTAGTLLKTTLPAPAKDARRVFVARQAPLETSP